MQSLSLYHNPKCSKSRQALTILQEAKVSVEVKLYLTEGIKAYEVQVLAKKLELFPTEFIRKNEVIHKQFHSKIFSLEEWSVIIETHPILLQRPIFVVGDQAIIARPPDRIRQLI